MFSNEGCSENENPLNIMIKCSKLADRSLSIQVALFCSILLVWCLMLWICLLQPKFRSENYYGPRWPSKLPNSRRFQDSIKFQTSGSILRTGSCWLTDCSDPPRSLPLLFLFELRRDMLQSCHLFYAEKYMLYLTLSRSS